MEDLWRSIRAFMYERTTSPLGGAFVVAWLVFNYRVLVILSSGDHYDDKFSMIDEYFFVDLVSNAQLLNSLAGKFLWGVVGPAVLTVIYLFGYPLIAAPVFEKTLSQRKRLREIKQKADNARLLTAEESRKLYKRLDDIDELHSEESDRLNRKIADLQQTIIGLENEIASSSATPAVTEVDDGDDVGAGDDTDLDIYDSQIEKAVAELDDRDFLVSGLFSTEEWGSFLAVVRQGLGRRFKSKVDRGDFLGVVFTGKNSSNQAVYHKSISDLDDLSKQSSNIVEEVSKRTRLEKSELENYRASIKKRGLSESDFQLVEDNFEATKSGVHALSATVTITFTPTGISKRYKTGHRSSWPFLFDTDLDRGAFFN